MAYFKIILPIMLLSLAYGAAFAQQNNDCDYNPFCNLDFSDKPFVKTTVSAVITGRITPLAHGDSTTLMTLSHLYKIKVKKINSSLTATIENYHQEIEMPFESGQLPALLSTERISGKKYRFEIVVYRFFFPDGLRNFFYITKIVPSKISN